MALPGRADVLRAVESVEGREDIFGYLPTADMPDAMEWYVNFADPHLFVAYGSALFAQDEMQVAEHPALGSLKEALEAGGHTTLTVENGVPTPILVTGVERRCRVATDRNTERGHPDGLYGNAFARASEAAVQAATARIEPPTITNFIAIAAPHGGRGPYTQDEVEHILRTAFTGFRAAQLESDNSRTRTVPMIVHTGFWGCGAFGGHRVLMAMLQVLAAGMAGVSRLVFHCFNQGGVRALAEATTRLRAVAPGGTMASTGQLIGQVVDMGFRWGVSDGN